LLDATMNLRRDREFQDTLELWIYGGSVLCEKQSINHQSCYDPKWAPFSVPPFPESRIPTTCIDTPDKR
jgi:hypothetical protein